MSHTQKKTEGATPGERKSSRQEPDWKADIVKMFSELKTDIKSSEKNLESKLGQMETKLEQMDNKIDLTVNELKDQMKEIVKKILKLSKEHRIWKKE